MSAPNPLDDVNARAAALETERHRILRAMSDSLFQAIESMAQRDRIDALATVTARINEWCPRCAVKKQSGYCPSCNK